MTFFAWETSFFRLLANGQLDQEEIGVSVLRLGNLPNHVNFGALIPKIYVRCAFRGAFSLYLIKKPRFRAEYHGHHSKHHPSDIFAKIGWYI